MAPGGLTCECGSRIFDGATCEAVYHEILAAEQVDPVLGRWHTVVVCAYLLQHPSQGYGAFLDGQFRILQHYRAQGLDALLRFTAHQRTLNRHAANAGYDMSPLEPYTALPDREPPSRFARGFPYLQDLVDDFGRDAYLAYQRRLDAVADATIAAWLGQDVA